MAKKKPRGGVGFQSAARHSKQLGGADPRARRTAEGFSTEALNVRDPIVFDTAGRLTVKKALRVDPLPSTATLAEAITAYNALISSLKAAGLLEK